MTKCKYCNNPESKEMPGFCWHHMMEEKEAASIKEAMKNGSLEDLGIVGGSPGRIHDIEEFFDEEPTKPPLKN